MVRQIVLDTETTGLEPEQGHRIVEIGARVIKNRELSEEIFHTYLNPDRESDAKAFEVHKLSQSFLQGQPSFGEIIDDFLQFLLQDGKESELIIHNAKFDIAFLDAELDLLNRASSPPARKTYKKMSQCCKVTDTLKLARELYPNQRNSLDALCRRHTIDNSKRDAHGALIDTALLAQVYLRMTAGQPSLFGMPTPKIPPIPSMEENTANPVIPNLPIYYANAEEIKAHETYLAAIAKVAGTCFWESEKSKQSTTQGTS